MRPIFILALLANLVLLMVSHSLLPGRMITHWGPDGPDGWCSKGFFTLAFIGVNILFFALFYYLPIWATRIPPKMINIPNKEYWFQTENLDECRVKLVRMFAEIGILILVVIFFCVLATVDANLGRPLLGIKTPGVIPVVLLSWVYGAFWVIRLVKTFKIPS